MLELARDRLEVGIVMHDVPAMKHFYEELLGLEPTGSFPTPGIGVRHTYRFGSNVIKLIEPEVALDARPAQGRPWEAAGMRYWTAFVTNLDAMVARLDGAGTTFLVTMTEPAPGIRYVIAADPDGNGVELVERA